MVNQRDRVETVTDLAIQLDVSRRAIHDWMKKPGFPKEKDGSFIPSKVAEWRQRSFMEKHDIRKRLRADDVTAQVQTFLEAIRGLSSELGQMVPEDYRQSCVAWFEAAIELEAKRAFGGGTWGLQYDQGELKTKEQIRQEMFTGAGLREKDE